MQLTRTGLEAAAARDRRADGPPSVRRSNGESVLVEHGAARYTTQDLLDAEQRLLDHAHAPTPHGLAASQVDDFLAGFEERNDVVLDPGQRRLVHAFATDGRRLVVGIGPAGAGKTTAMRALTQAWRTTGRRVIPLAPSAAAADVLRDELGCRTENLHKFRHTHASQPPAGQATIDEWFQLQPGDLVLVDEAGMAGTRNLDWLTSLCPRTRRRGPASRRPRPAVLGRSRRRPRASSPATPTPSSSPTCTASTTRTKQTPRSAIRDGRPEGLDVLRHPRPDPLRGAPRAPRPSPRRLGDTTCPTDATRC